MWEYIKIAPLARAAGIEPRALQYAVKNYLETGKASEALMQANEFLAEQSLRYDELVADPQAQSYLRDLRRLGWSTEHILKVALVEFWHSKDIVRCPKCECAVLYPPEIPMETIEMELECSFCKTRFEYKEE